MRLSPRPPLVLLLAACLAPAVAAEETDADTLAGMDAEVQGDWVTAAQAFARAFDAAPRDIRRGTRLRAARQRGMDFLKPQIDLLLKEKRLEEAARAVAAARLIDPTNAAANSAARRLEQAGVAIPEIKEEPVCALFPHRSAAGRLRCWAMVGAPFGRAEKIIDDGIAFLLKTQDEKGGWDSKKCGGYWTDEAGFSALALLVLLADGPGGLAGDRGAAARKAADYLVKAQTGNGNIGEDSERIIYCTTLAAEALSEYALTTGEVERFRPTLERARDAILDAQNAGAGWRYKPRSGQSDTAVTGRAVSALHRLRLAGIDFPGDATNGAVAWIDSMAEPHFGQVGYNFPGGAPARFDEKEHDRFPPEHSHSMTSAGILATCYLAPERTWMPRGLARLTEEPPTKKYPDFYYWNLGAHAYVAWAGGVSPNWYAALVDAAAACAKPDGGMDACDPWREPGGRIYSTAMVVLALAAPFDEPPSRVGKVCASTFLRDRKREVQVVPDAVESPTGIYVEPGMVVRATARGAIFPWRDSPAVGPEGTKDEPKSEHPLLKGAPFACLLGKIGPDGKLFRIQPEKPISLTSCGHLILLVNQKDPGGIEAWTVEIRQD